MRNEFKVGDRVRIDIPDESDPEHHLHGQHGEIAEFFEDGADKLTGNNRDAKLYRIKLQNAAEVDFRRRDIRPPIED